MAPKQTTAAHPIGEAAATSSGIAADESPTLTPTQRKIQELLSVESSSSPAEVYTALAALESREMPESIQTRELLDPVHHPASCCFDKTPSHTWAAWNLCERCALLNEILQGELIAALWA